jgi:HK97 family phage portal protein
VHSLTTIRRTIGAGIVKAFGLNDMFLSGKEMPWAPGFGGSGNVQAAYENSDTAYSCIRRKAQDISSAPLLFLVNPDNSTREVQPNHPIRKLWAKPSRHFSREQVLQFFVTFMELRGEAFLTFDDPERPTTMSPHLDPLYWRFDAAADGSPVIWHMRHDTQFADLMPSEIMHHRYVCTTDPYRGQSPLRAAANKYAIATGGDALQRSIIERGGERGILYKVPETFTAPQREMALAALRGRRQNKNAVGNDSLLPNGVEVVDPRFIEDDYDILAAMPRSEDGICNVFGVPASLLSGKDDNYATFRGRQKVYWANTLVPAIRGIESAFDDFFGREFGVFIRFDLAKIEALKDNLGDQVTIAAVLKSAGWPWAAIEDLLKIGTPLALIPEAKTVLVNAMLAPADKLIEEWNQPPAPEPAPAPVPPPPLPAPVGDGKGAPHVVVRDGSGRPLTNSLIRKRALDARETIGRTRRMAKLERELRTGWRSLLSTWKGKAVRAVAGAGGDVSRIEQVLRDMQPQLGKAMVDLTSPAHLAAAREGMTSILLITGKVDFGDQQIVRDAKVPELSPVAREWVLRRQNRISGMADDLVNDIFKKLTAQIATAVADGTEPSEIANLVAGAFDIRGNRAVTIARTEVGTAYNVSRFAEMGEQGFEDHEWMTAEDELVRGSEEGDEFDHASCDGEVRAIGELFPCGLAYPMEDGAEAGNTVNCRCQTLPRVKEAA